MRTIEGSTLNFTIDDIRKSMMYDIIVRYEPVHPGTWNNVEINVERDGPVDPDGPCADWRPEDDHLWVQLPPNARSAVAQPAVCLEAGKIYTVSLKFKDFNWDGQSDVPTASILVDSIVLRPRITDLPFFKGNELGELRRQDYDRFRCNDYFNDVSGYNYEIPETCKKYQHSIGYYVYDGAHCEFLSVNFLINLSYSFLIIIF